MGALGAVSYNWWIAAASIPGLLRSPNGFFSDLEAQGLRDSSAFQHADVIGAAKAHGLIDNKMVAFSDTQTSLRFTRARLPAPAAPEAETSI